MSIKNARFKSQPSMRSTLFMEIDDKGGEIVQRYESFEIEIVQGGEIRYKSSKKQRLDMDMDKEGATLKKRDGSKFLNKRIGQEKHTSRGDKLMNSN